MLRKIPASEIDDFVRLSTFWRLPGILRNQFSATDGLIADMKFFKALDDRFSIAGVNHLTPEQALSELPKGVKRFLVLSDTNELGLVRRLRNKYPGRVFASVIYDFAPMQISHRFTFAQIKTGPSHHVTRPLCLLLTLPGADGEFLAQNMNAAGLPVPAEYLDPAHVAYLELGGKIDPLRYFYQAVGWSPSNQKFAIHLQADVLFSLIEREIIGFDRLTEMVNAGDVKIIYLSRRDKLFQAGFIAAMERTKFRSAWKIPVGFKGRLHAETDPARPYQIMQELLDMEIKLESWFSSLAKPVKMITLESLVHAPREILADVSQYLGDNADLTADLPDYKSLFKRFPWLADSSRSFRRDLIDRLGLHMNSFGSYVTDGDTLID